MTLDSSEIKNFLFNRISAVLKSFLLSSASSQVIYPCSPWPINRVGESWHELHLKPPKFNCSIFLEEEVCVEAVHSSSLQPDSSGCVVLLVQHQSTFLNELEYWLGKMMRNEVLSASVSPSLQACLRSFENLPQFSSLVLRVSPFLLKCPPCPHGSYVIVRISRELVELRVRSALRKKI